MMFKIPAVLTIERKLLKYIDIFHLVFNELFLLIGVVSDLDQLVKYLIQ